MEISTSSDSVPVDEMKDLLTCSLCSKTLSEPRSMPCLHNFCEACLGKYVERLRGGDEAFETFPCPTCRSDFTLKSDEDVTELPSNCFIKNILGIMATKGKAKALPVCLHCEERAINHCASCEVFMCRKCSESHNTWLKNHTVLSVQELDNPENEAKMKNQLYCTKHQKEILNIYCETCQELSCIHCMFLNHTKPSHSCVAVNEVAQKHREKLQSNCTTLDEKLCESKEALNNICEVIKSLKKNAHTVKDQIKKQKDSILKTVAEKLDERVKKMHEKVDEVYGELHNELSKQHDEINDFLDKVQASLSLPRNLLKRGSDEEILSLHKSIDQCIKELKRAQPDNLDALNDGSLQYVPDDIDDINAAEIVGKMGRVEGDPSVPDDLRKSSSILQGELAFMRRLQEWLGEKCKWNLCYRACKDGWSAHDFHKYCDNKGPTVVLVKANDYIFGGYTDQNWQGGGWKCSSSSFLFSLRNKEKLAPFIASIKQDQEQNAIWCNASYGPFFGGGYDLYICNNPQVNQSYSNFGRSYRLPPNYIDESDQARNLLAGHHQFITTEIEVFN